MPYLPTHVILIVVGDGAPQVQSKTEPYLMSNIKVYGATHPELIVPNIFTRQPTQHCNTRNLMTIRYDNVLSLCKACRGAHTMAGDTRKGRRIQNGTRARSSTCARLC